MVDGSAKRAGGVGAADRGTRGGRVTSPATGIGPVVRSADQGEAVWTMGQLMLVKASSEETGGEMAAMDLRMNWMAAPPLHIHHHESAVNILLERAVTARWGDETRESGPARFVYPPKRVPSAFLLGSSGSRMSLSA